MQGTILLSSPVATVALSSPTHTTREDGVMVDVCAVFLMPGSDLWDCPVVFPFNITISTADGSAGIFS